MDKSTLIDDIQYNIDELVRYSKLLGKYNYILTQQYTEDNDVSHATKLGYIRRAITAGVQIGLNKKLIPFYVYLGGGYGEYGRQWRNLTELNKNIYFHSDYVKGIEGEAGVSCVLYDWLSISAGGSAVFASGKMSADFQLCAGISIDQKKLFKRKKR